MRGYIAKARKETVIKDNIKMDLRKIDVMA
jgi:hypothetical protein